jgi:predicted nucleotidyltransferase
MTKTQGGLCVGRIHLELVDIYQNQQRHFEDTSSMDLVSYARSRDELLERIVATLQTDSRVVAAWLSGSFGRGVEDAWSDLDLHVAVEDESLPAFLDERIALYRSIGEPILVQREKISNATPAGTFQLVMYPGPIEVDWNIGPVSQTGRPPETKIVFARREMAIQIPSPPSTEERRAQATDALAFFWAMTPIAIKYVGRGESRRASSQIDLLTGAFIWLWRLVERPDGPNPAAPFQNRSTEPELDAILPRLGWEITPGSALTVVQALCSEVERLHPSLEALGISPPRELVGEVATLANLARVAIQDGPSSAQRVFRQAEPIRRLSGRRFVSTESQIHQFPPHVFGQRLRQHAFQMVVVDTARGQVLVNAIGLIGAPHQAIGSQPCLQTPEWNSVPCAGRN